jgi:hypothetical protein
MQVLTITRILIPSLEKSLTNLPFPNLEKISTRNLPTKIKQTLNTKMTIKTKKGKRTRIKKMSSKPLKKLSNLVMIV